MSNLFLLSIALIIAGIALLALAFYIRLVPADPDTWHEVTAAPAPGDYPSESGFLAVRAVDGSASRALTRADQVIRATPRTAWFAGSLAEGRITYVTRSALWGFPDYTTVWTEGSAAPIIAIHGRLRFGRSDTGVNRARIEGWLGELGLASTADGA
jgi:hypothetical protein